MIWTYKLVDLEPIAKLSDNIAATRKAKCEEVLQACGKEGWEAVTAWTSQQGISVLFKRAVSSSGINEN